MATSSSGSDSQKPPETMKRVDLKRDEISPGDRQYMARMSRAHMESVQKLSRAKYIRKNVFVALCLGAGVLGVYGYSIYSVSQEAFLEDFEDPNKPKEL
ncbi:cytochrome c oxidase assembly factor 3, mitochondrial-like [Patiria miniata]|uniref:Cytochrome c oxidase assembly factor 3 n=1 Tax=Patiria miniata TaxID=46514 RepID=A0A913YZV3_PATMI|nr:cytochrome c oxidase assembly factor 3, mitochondrial-like [Patiria miniata]